MKPLTSRERLQRIFRREPVDRVPIYLYEFHGFYDNWIRDYPGYVEILDYAADKCDDLHTWNPPTPQNVLFGGELDEDAVTKEHWEEDGSKFTRTNIKTPTGPLSMLHREDPGIHTAWQIEHLCKNVEDARNVLSLPFVPYKGSVESFAEMDAELGDRGLPMGDMADALAHTVDLFGFATFLMIYVDQPTIIFRLLDFFQERILARLEYQLAGGAVSLYRIVGAEYAGVPYMSPDDFKKVVTSYDREMVNLLHRYGGQARIHSHGNIRDMIPELLAMKIDATDPVEPPPDGNIELAEARELLGEDVILFGNVEECIFEIGTPGEVREAVRIAIEAVEGKNFVLTPTAMPLTTPLDPKIKDNILAYIDAGIEFGSSRSTRHSGRLEERRDTQC